MVIIPILSKILIYISIVLPPNPIFKNSIIPAILGAKLASSFRFT